MKGFIKSFFGLGRNTPTYDEEQEFIDSYVGTRDDLPQSGGFARGEADRSGFYEYDTVEGDYQPRRWWFSKK